MTDKKTEALKLALDALKLNDRRFMMDNYSEEGETRSSGIKAIVAIKEALAEQPAQQQEPVALSQAVYTVLEGFTLPHDVRKILESAYYSDQPASKPWVGLTDEEIESAMPGGIYDCLADPWDCNVGDGDYMRSIKKDVLRVARSAIAAYEEKNGITGEKA